MGCVPGVLTRVLTSQTSCAATVQRLLWKGCFVASGLVPDGVSPPCDSLKSPGVQSTEIRYASPEFSKPHFRLHVEELWCVSPELPREFIKYRLRSVQRLEVKQRGEASPASNLLLDSSSSDF